MKLYWLMAVRNLRRHLRRTILTISGMALGFAVLFWLQCVLKGTNQQIVDSVTSTQVGHLQIWRSEYLKEPLDQYSFQPHLDKLRSALPEGSLFSERVHMPALISSGEQSAPISLKGVHPQLESSVTNLKSNLKEGEYLSENEDPECKNREIYIGRALANLLRVGIGDKVVIMAQATDGSLGNELLRVRGLFDTGSNVFDRQVAYAPIACVQKIGVIQGDHELTIRLPQGADINAAQSAIGASLGSVGDNLQLTTWKDVVPPLAGMVSFNEATLLLISLVLFSVTTFGVINTLLMSVFERTREFGVMLALGVTPRGVCLLILFEAACIGLMAAMIGTAIGVIWVLYHQHTGFDLQPFLGKNISVSEFKLNTIVYPIFSFARYFKLTAATVAFAVVAGLFPALKAARMDVVEAIRHR